MGKRERVRLDGRYPRIRLNRRVFDVWEPSWDNNIERFAKNYIRKNRWRFDRINDFNDLMQDAYVAFLKVREAYPRVVEAKHFMSLYVTTLKNVLWDRSRQYERKLLVEREDISINDDNLNFDNIVGETTNYGFLSVMLEDGPPELKLLLQFLNDDDNLEELRKPQRTRRDEPRVSQDRRLSNLLGIDYYNFRQSMKQWLYA